jgi:hypothetical protein
MMISTVNTVALVGEQSEVVLKRLYAIPHLESLLGVGIRPPKADVAPKPISSININNSLEF